MLTTNALHRLLLPLEVRAPRILLQHEAAPTLLRGDDEVETLYAHVYTLDAPWHAMLATLSVVTFREEDPGHYYGILQFGHDDWELPAGEGRHPAPYAALAYPAPPGLEHQPRALAGWARPRRPNLSQYASRSALPVRLRDPDSVQRLEDVARAECAVQFLYDEFLIYCATHGLHTFDSAETET